MFYPLEKGLDKDRRKGKEMLGRAFSASLIALCLFSSALSRKSALADQTSDFYRGKLVRLVVGAPAGGGYDLVARVIATRLGAHIPGHPNVVVENLGAAGGLVMANALYNTLPRDGTVIGMPTSAIPLEPRLKLLTRDGGGADFDVGRFNWLGSAAQQPQVMFFWRTTPVERPQDLKKTKVLFGAIMGSDSYWLPVVMDAIMGWKLQIVPGYQGFGDILLAMERGEIQGHSAVYANLTAAKPDWLRDRKVKILVQFGRERSPELPDAPTAVEIAPNEIDREMLRFFALKYSMAYSLIAPPDVPVERVAALRDAFAATMKDPLYIAAAKQISLPINPVSGQDEVGLIDEIERTPDAVVQKLRAIMDSASNK
jgi:tripartite-type tricarboxylate transporter receptor subunit TctC